MRAAPGPLTERGATPMETAYDGPMAMRARPVRASDGLWDMFEEFADKEGISVSQLMREATLAYISWRNGQRDPAGMAEAYETLINRIREQTRPNGS